MITMQIEHNNLVLGSITLPLVYFVMLVLAIVFALPHDFTRHKPTSDFHSKSYKSALIMMGMALVTPFSQIVPWSTTLLLFGVGFGAGVTSMAWFVFVGPSTAPKIRKRVGHSETVR